MALVGTIAFSGSILSLGCLLLRSVPKLLKNLISPVLVWPSPSASPSPSVHNHVGLRGLPEVTNEVPQGEKSGPSSAHHGTCFVSLRIGESRSTPLAHLLMTSRTKLAAVGMFVVIRCDAGSVQVLHIIKALAHVLSIYIDLLPHLHIVHVWVIVSNFHSLVCCAARDALSWVSSCDDDRPRSHPLSSYFFLLLRASICDIATPNAQP